jgi:hypothetical protein
VNERLALSNSNWLVQTSWEGTNIFILQLQKSSDFKLRKPKKRFVTRIIDLISSVDTGNAPLKVMASVNDNGLRNKISYFRLTRPLPVLKLIVKLGINLP